MYSPRAYFMPDPSEPKAQFMTGRLLIYLGLICLLVAAGVGAAGVSISAALLFFVQGLLTLCLGCHHQFVAMEDAAAVAAASPRPAEP